MALVIKVSKEGFDVLEETDPKNLIFDSTLNHLKTYKSGSHSQTLGNGASATITVVHGLTYRPLAMAFWKEDTTGVWRIASTDPENSELKPGTNSNLSIYCDTSNLYLKMYNGNGSGGDRDYTIEYEIFYEGDS